ncbi:MAG: hypothetical protein A2Y24_01095 [Clostridiales bacterium GWE2_32_10]|nr:MAG: hypothetical protein A2Y24_01095 [Clostridiales bacterium GWE2_32_10]HBY21210.1 hypothetical protein [Clostridiales bacterium]
MRRYLSISFILGILGILMYANCFDFFRKMRFDSDDIARKVINLLHNSFNNIIIGLIIIIIIAVFVVFYKKIDTRNIVHKLITVTVLILTVIINCGFLWIAYKYVSGVPALDLYKEKYVYNFEKVSNEEIETLRELAISISKEKFNDKDELVIDENLIEEKLQLIENKNMGFTKQILIENTRDFNPSFVTNDNALTYMDYSYIADYILKYEEMIQNDLNSGNTILVNERFKRALNLEKHLLNFKNPSIQLAFSIKMLNNRNMEFYINNYAFFDEKSRKDIMESFNYLDKSITKFIKKSCLVELQLKKDDEKVKSEYIKWPINKYNDNVKLLEEMLQPNIDNQLVDNNEWRHDMSFTTDESIKLPAFFYPLKLNKNRLEIINYLNDRNYKLSDNIKLTESEGKINFELSDETEYNEETKKDENIKFVVIAK